MDRASLLTVGTGRAGNRPFPTSPERQRRGAVTPVAGAPGSWGSILRTAAGPARRLLSSWSPCEPRWRALPNLLDRAGAGTTKRNVLARNDFPARYSRWGLRGSSPEVRGPAVVYSHPHPGPDPPD